MKLTVIGAGSTYSPELIDGIVARTNMFPVTEIAFMDIDENRLKWVTDFCQRMVIHRKSTLEITSTISLKKALRGADFVVTQIRVGGQESRNWDINLGKKHGIIGQETTGVGGFSKAMRTIPDIMQICRTIEEVAPKAWLINFTNPSGIVTEAISRYSDVKCIGLCNVPINMLFNVAKLLEVDPKEIYLDYVGLNHLSWVRHVYHNGEDVTARVLKKTINEPANISPTAIAPEFLDNLQMIPSPYLKYFYNTPRILKEQSEAKETRAEQVMKLEEELFRLYRDPMVATKPEILSKRGGAYYSHIAVEIMTSIYHDSNDIFIANVPNQGALSGLENEDVVEIPAVVGKRTPQPLVIGKVEPEIAGLINQVKAYERLTVEAAVEKNIKKAILALVNNPLVFGVDQAMSLVTEIDQHYNLKLV